MLYVITTTYVPDISIKLYFYQKMSTFKIAYVFGLQYIRAYIYSKSLCPVTGCKLLLLFTLVSLQIHMRYQGYLSAPYK